MLLIKAKGGLGNRMLSAASAIAYAEATQRNWSIDWCDGLYADYGVNAYPLLFSNADAALNLPISTQRQVMPKVWQGKLSCAPRELISRYYPNAHSSPLVYRKLSAALTTHQPDNKVEVFWAYTSKIRRIARFLSKQQRSKGLDHLMSDVLSRYFLVRSDIQGVGDALLAQLSGQVLGVHVRYTDLKIPLSKLMQVVVSELGKNDYQHIFLATDSQEIQDLFSHRFDNVLMVPKSFADGNAQLHTVSDNAAKEEAAVQALTDMYTLSRCDGLIYCSRSTFGETARLMGAFDSSRVRDVDRYNPVIRLKRIVQEYL